jgi:hypothetical protein
MDIPKGRELDDQWQKLKRQAVAPALPDAWTASVLLTPFGDSIAPQANPSQLVVAKIESASVGAMNWMRAKLYLTQDLVSFDFLFVSVDGPGRSFQSNWYWIDSSTQFTTHIYGPFKTTLRVPGPQFIEDNGAQWGNRYPLMCTDTNPGGIDCDHWIIPTPGASDHGSWYAFRQDTGNSGNLFRIHTMDSNNPMMIPVLGSYFIANLPSVQAGVSQESNQLVEGIVAGWTPLPPVYDNPMITQQDIQRALASPIAFARCTIEDIQYVMPGFTPAAAAGTPLPQWSENTYIEGWALALDLIPYVFRVSYRWTGDEKSQQQAIFIGQGQTPGAGSYRKRSDTCLSTSQTDIPYYSWNDKSKSWRKEGCLRSITGVGLPLPNWLARSGAIIMGQISGNPDFGLQAGETLNMIAAQLPLGGGESTIFWTWFLDNGVGMLFSEAKYLNPLSHLIQLVDYNLFLRDAPITSNDFSNPCSKAKPAIEMSDADMRIHLGRFHGGRGNHPPSRQ